MAWRGLVQPLAAKAAALDPRRAAADGGPAMGILAAIAQRVGTAIERQQDWPFGIFGMPRDGVVAAYTAAGVPVVRWQLNRPRALWDTLSAAEQAAGVRGRPGSRDGLQTRRYAFGSANSRRLELVFAAGDGFGLVTLDARGFDDETLDQALGVTRPLAPYNPAHLDTMAAAYGLIPGTVAFIDNQRLLDALSGEPGEHLDELVDGITATPDATDGQHSALDNPDCLATANAIVDFWPRTVIGVPALADANGYFSLRLIGEVANLERLATLDRVRGHVPEIAWSPRGVLALGLGLDLSTLHPIAEGLRAALVDFSVSCEIFANTQRRLARAAAAALEPVEDALAEREDLADIRGAAAVLFNGGSRNGRSLPQAPDGVLMIATEEPDATWRLIRSVMDADVEARPELEGKAASLLRWPAITEDEGQSVRVALRETAVAVLVGDAELPTRADAEPETLVPNGLFVLRYENGELWRHIERATKPLTAPDAPRGAQAVVKIAKMLRATGLNLRVSVDVVEAGINVDVSAAAADREL